MSDWDMTPSDRMEEAYQRHKKAMKAKKVERHTEKIEWTVIPPRTGWDGHDRD